MPCLKNWLDPGCSYSTSHLSFGIQESIVLPHLSSMAAFGMWVKPSTHQDGWLETTFWDTLIDFKLDGVADSVTKGISFRSQTLWNSPKLLSVGVHFPTRKVWFARDQVLETYTHGDTAPSLGPWYYVYGEFTEPVSGSIRLFAREYGNGVTDLHSKLAMITVFKKRLSTAELELAVKGRATDPSKTLANYVADNLEINQVPESCGLAGPAMLSSCNSIALSWPTGSPQHEPTCTNTWMTHDNDVHTGAIGSSDYSEELPVCIEQPQCPVSVAPSASNIVVGKKNDVHGSDGNIVLGGKNNLQGGATGLVNYIRSRWVVQSSAAGSFVGKFGHDILYAAINGTISSTHTLVREDSEDAFVASMSVSTNRGSAAGAVGFPVTTGTVATGAAGSEVLNYVDANLVSDSGLALQNFGW